MPPSPALAAPNSPTHTHSRAPSSVDGWDDARRLPLLAYNGSNRSHDSTSLPGLRCPALATVVGAGPSGPCRPPWLAGAPGMPRAAMCKAAHRGPAYTIFCRPRYLLQLGQKCSVSLQESTQKGIKQQPAKHPSRQMPPAISHVPRPVCFAMRV